mgnify:CR=1 FL=1
MTKETLIALADELSTEELDSLIQALYHIKQSRIEQPPDGDWDEAELDALLTSDPKDGAWIVANNPSIGAWSDMTGDTLEWSIQLRKHLEGRTHERD